MTRYHLATQEIVCNDMEECEKYDIDLTRRELQRQNQQRKRKYARLIVAILGGISLLFFAMLHQSTKPSRHGAGLDSLQESALPLFYQSKEAEAACPLNSTLNFGKIYVINMPSRTDKRAEMTLLAGHHNLSIHFVAGIDGREMRPDLNDDQQGKWGVAAAHARVWQTIVDDGVGTALIFEDDVDFDIRLRQQLELLRAPLATYLSLAETDGEDLQRSNKCTWLDNYWEMFWLGSVYETPQYSATVKDKIIPKPYLTYEDFTVTGPSGDRWYVKNMFDSYGLRKGNTPQKIRMISKPNNIWGLQGYAVTATGAKKLLYFYAHHRNQVEHIDGQVAQMMYDGRLNGIMVLPPIFSQFRRPSGDRDSDREGKAAAELPGQEGYSLGVTLSAKKALAHQLNVITDMYDS